VASGGSSNSHLSLIAGCATAGGIVILILIVLTVFHCRRWRVYRSPSPNQATTAGKYKSHGLTSADSSTVATAHTFTGATRTPPPGALPYRDRNRDDAEKDGAASSSPESRSAIRPLPRTPSHNQLLVDGGANAAAVDPHVDINALAMVVACVLLHTPPRHGARQHPADSSLRNNNSAARNNNNKRGMDDSGSGWYNESGESDETDRDRHSATAPPHYRAT
jgi:hypothetical protein